MCIRDRRMVEGLLNYSQVQKASLKLQEINFADVIHAAKNNLALTIKETNTQIDIGDMPDVTVDFSLMINVMQNLIGNAIKHCNLPQPEIQISSEEIDSAYLIKVKDNARGISENQLEEIFNIFRSIKTDDNTQHSGVGLAICKNIIEKHKGKISVESKVGVGSTFIIQIPKT